MPALALRIRTTFKMLTTLTALTLAACGGGGGGGGSSSGNGNSSSGSTVSRIAFDSSNSAEVGTQVNAYFESMLEFAALGVASVDLSNQANDLTQPIVCDAHGAFLATLTDRDNNQRISSGDKIQFHYAPCDLRIAGASIVGDITLEISSFSGDAANGNWTLNATATINGSITSPDPSNTNSISGAYNIAYHFSNTGDSLRITNSATPFSITSDGSTEQLTSFDITKTIDSSQGSYSITGSFSDSSDGNVLPCTILTPYSGSIAQLPRAGKFQCDGANGTAMQFAPIDDAGGTVFLNTGNGSFQTLYQTNYGGLLDGLLQSPVLIKQPYGRGAGYTITTNFEVYKYSFAPGATTVFAITTNTDPDHPQQLLQIDSFTGNLTRSLALPFSPSDIAVSADGSVIYVSYYDSSEVDIFDQNLFTKTAQLDLGSDPGNPQATLGATTLIVSPTDANLVVAETVQSGGNLSGFPIGIFAYKNGIRLSNDVSFSQLYCDRCSIKLSGDGNKLFVAISYGLVSFDIDTNGLSLTPNTSADGAVQSNSLAFDFTFDGPILYTVKGTVYDSAQLATSAITGLSCDDYDCQSIFADPYTDLLYTYDAGGNGTRILSVGISNIHTKTFSVNKAVNNLTAGTLSSLNRNQFISETGEGGLTGHLNFVGKNPLFSTMSP